jgi:competence protein ComEA
MRRLLNILFVAGILAAASGGIAILVLSSRGGGIEVSLPTPAPASTVDLKVHVSGAVNSPGVYTVSDGARILDAIEIAGGAAPDADLDAINLAVRLRDEDKVVVPLVGESSPTSQSPTTSGLIDINSADALALTALPGIGQTRAEAIVRHRDQNGSFTRIQDLLEVSGIGPATLDAIIDLVEVR